MVLFGAVYAFFYFYFFVLCVCVFFFSGFSFFFFFGILGFVGKHEHKMNIKLRMKNARIDIRGNS